MKISASLHAADPLRLAFDIAAVAPSVGSLHVDIMDGRFAPAFGFGERLVSRLVAERAPPVDVHLMLDHPEPWARRFAALGSRSVAFHLEAVSNPVAVSRSIRDEGALAYIALLPDTPISDIVALLPDIDGILLLTAPPGGGPFSQTALKRTLDLPKGVPTIVDGGLGPQHFETLRACAVEFAVVGRALFDNTKLQDAAANYARMASGDCA